MKLRPSQDNGIVLGTTLPPGRPYPISLSQEEQAYHATIWGRSGSGKSRFLQSLFLQYLNRGQGVCLIDPHHDLSYATLTSLIEHGFYRDTRAYERLIYLDWGNGWVVPFNVLQGRSGAQSTALQVLESCSRWCQTDGCVRLSGCLYGTTTAVSSWMTPSGSAGPSTTFTTPSAVSMRRST